MCIPLTWGQSTPAPPPASPDQPVLHSSTELILIPAVVHDQQGSHISNLQKDDFVVLQDGKPQKIAIFEEIKATTTPIEKPKAEEREFTNILRQDSSSKRLTVIALDLLNTDFIHQARMRQQVVESLLNNIKPDEMIALVKIHSQGLTVVHDFTHDSQELLAGLKVTLAKEKGELPGSQSAKLGDLPLEGGPARAASSLGMSASPQEVADFIDLFSAPAVYARESSFILQTLESLEHLAQSLAGIPGRKSLIWLTGEFPLDLDRDSPILEGQASEHYRRTIRALNDANIAVYSVDVRGISRVGTREAADASTRHDFWNPEDPIEESLNATVQTINSLETFAAATGGKAFYNRNDISAALRDALNDSASYYMLGYYLDRAHTAAGWRRLDVKLHRKGASVRSREGFFARPASATQSEANAEMSSAAQSPLDYTALPMTVKWTETGEADPRSGARKIGFEVVLPGGAASVENGRFQLEFVAMARDLAGKTVAELSQTIRGPATDQLRNGFTYRNAAILSPGEYQVRFVFRDSLSGQIGSVLAPLRVP
jgi:VWFA-related protein